MKPHTLAITIILSILINGYAIAQPVTFNDANLKAAVESALGISDPNASNMLKLTNLSAYVKGITDLTGLESAANLVSLSLPDNKISDISTLSGLTNLSSLWLSQNQISDLSALSGMTNLKYLTIQNNQISDISALSGMTNLVNLYLQGNPVSELSPLSGLTGLNKLGLSSIEISDLSALSGLTGLTQLSLSSCQITDISTLSGLVYLPELWLDGNQIRDISALAGLTGLTTLSLSNNPIGDLSSLSGLTNLSLLYLSNVQTSDLSPLSGLTQLTNLNLSNNQISDISALAGLTKIKDLFLSNNQISELSALAGMASLRQLILDKNQVSDISSLSGFNKLNYLYLSNNHISDILTLAAMTTLRYLVLEANPLCQEACTVYIPQIVANNPTVTIKSNPCISCDPQTPWIYVDDDAPNDLGPNNLWVSDANEDGSINHPYDAIQKGINAAFDGDTVVVLPGTYYETLNLMGKNIHLNGLDPNITNRTALPVIDANGLGTVLTFDHAEEANCLITGFVLTGGLGEQAGAIACIGSSPVIEHCLIVGNLWADANGGAVVLQDSNSVFINVTLADNVGFNGGAGLSLSHSNPLIQNSLLWNNFPAEILALNLSTPNVAYSTIAGTWPGPGNLSDDPLFAAPGFWANEADPNVPIDPFDPNAVFRAGDYHLMSETGRWDPLTITWVPDTATSPAIDTAAPGGIWIREPLPNGSHINQGVYGGTTQASKSLEQAF